MVLVCTQLKVQEVLEKRSNLVGEVIILEIRKAHALANLPLYVCSLYLSLLVSLPVQVTASALAKCPQRQVSFQQGS